MSTKDAKIDSAIKTGNFRNAQLLIDKKIKQYPNSSYFYALRAHVLALSNKRQQALEVAQELLSKFPSDPEALRLLIGVFGLCEHKNSEDVFEKVCKKYPTFELIYEWFSQTIDTGDIIGMQKATMALTRAISTSEPLFSSRTIKIWAATALMLVCRCCKSQLSASVQKLYPQLGIKLIEQVKPKDSQECYVHSQLLQLANKHEESLEVLRKFLGKENDLELKILYLETLESLEKYEELLEASGKYLVDEDDWNTWKLYIKAAEKSGKLDECLKTIQGYAVTRNSQLSLLQIAKVYEKVEFGHSFANYLSKYGSKLCCFQDLKAVVDSDRAGLLAILESEYEQKNISEIVDMKRKPSENELVFMVNYLKLKVFLDSSVLTTSQFVENCCLFYSSTKTLLNKLVEFEYFAGFEFIILAVEAILTTSGESDVNEELLVKLIVILENALVQNKYEFHLKLWLVKLYSQLNLVSRAEALFTSLNVKFVQLDTLSYYLTTRLSAVSTHNEQTLRVGSFYNQNVANEMPHMVKAGFQKLSLSKLQGFIEFYSRLDHSFTKYSNVLELVRAKRISDDQRAIDDLKPVLKEFYQIENLSDNRDTTTFWDCGVHEKLADVDSKLNKYNPSIDETYLRTMVLRELIIYDSESKFHEERVVEFLKLLKSEQLLQKVTPMEKWSLSVIASVLDSATPAERIPDEPEHSSVLEFQFNHYYFTLVDTYKQVQYLSTRYTQLRALSGQLKEKIQSFRSNSRELKALPKTKLDQLSPVIQNWFGKDPVGKLFKVDETFVKTTLKDIKVSLEDSILSLGKI